MLPISGAIFEANHPEEELNRLEARAATPDFWKDQAEAQKILQRRRRLEQDRDLVQSLRRKSDDLSVLLEWAQAGESVDAEFAALEVEAELQQLRRQVSSGRAANEPLPSENE